jgi:hypothetical protein
MCKPKIVCWQRSSALKTLNMLLWFLLFLV